MDFINQLLTNTACNVDGTINSNPLYNMMDSMLESSAVVQSSSMNIPFELNMEMNSMHIDHTYQHDYSQSSPPNTMQFQPNNTMVNPWSMMNNTPFELTPGYGMGMNMGMPLPYFQSMPMMIPGQMPYHYENSLIYNDESNQDINNYDDRSLFEPNPSVQSMEINNEIIIEENSLAYGPSKEGYESAWNNLSEKLSSGNFVNSTKNKEYIFEKNNHYDQIKKESNANTNELFEKAMNHYNNGKLKEAILLFETIVKNDNSLTADLMDESWRMLGVCHAENEEDKKAILCLEKAVECDPFNLDSLLLLGTSYVNELDSVRALETLRTWVAHNPNLQGLSYTADEYSDGSLMDEVMQLMISAAEYAPHDLQIQIVLGVLYNVSMDYDAAVECFHRVVQQNPNDFSLLNKLAATFANGNRSEQALPYYMKSLQLRPTFARGWLNLGISHANMNNYSEAAKAYVQALHVNPNARHIWGYLRVVFSCMDRLDLVELSGKEDVFGLAAALGLQLINLS
eukprot:gene4868-6820_t